MIKNKTEMAKNIPVAEAVSPNQINAGTVIHGDIICNGNIRIDGTLRGKIECSGKVVIGTSGQVEGDIVCANIDILGLVKGNVLVAEKTALKSSCRLTGDLQTGSLSIEPGAEFNGKCTMTATADIQSLMQQNIKDSVPA
jgi:cytoskeletal protein CcmA (bactofilin family)